MRLRLWLPLVLLIPVAVLAQRQPFHAPIGNSVVSLTGPWVFHPGDNLAWAQPDFDDSSWKPMDLGATADNNDPISGAQGYISGWTAKGFPNLSGYAWYRIRIQVDNNAATADQGALALQMPEDVDDAYQVFVEGRFVGEFGHFTNTGVSFIGARPRSFRLPAELRGGLITVAVRMWMDAATPFNSPDAGGLHSAPMIGQAAAIDAMERLDWYDVDRGETGSFIVCPLALLAALLGLILFLLDRREPSYLWLSLAATASLGYAVLVLCAYYTSLSMMADNIFLDVLLRPLSFLFWAVFWSHWFRLEEIRPIIRVASALCLLVAFFTATLRAPLYGHVVPPHASAWIFPASVICKLAFGAIILWIVYRGIRKHRSEGWLALPAVAPMFGYLYQTEMLTFHIPTVVYIWSVVLTVGNIALLLTLAAVSILMLRRFIGGLREKEQMRQELEQARQVQQVMVPEALPATPGFALESEYRPAMRVGGDFFQIIPYPADGSVLIVAGDVAGKGLQAGMLVSLLIGAIHSTAEITSDPLALLQALNRRLLGRSDARATCLALRIEEDGHVILANAGHLPPYWNEKELEIEGSLPLGLVADADFTSVAFQMSANDRLLLLSDGVAEATDGKGMLFGFDRVQELILSRPTAVSIANAAQAFGQNDDISVISVTRTTVAEPALA